MRLIILFILLVYACATKPLVTRGLPEKEREFYVVQNGWDLSSEVKQHFKKGLPLVGMTETLIFSLYGAPDMASTVKKDSSGVIEEYNWAYFDIINNKGGIEVIIEFIFDKDEKLIKIVGEPCKVIGNCEKL